MFSISKPLTFSSRDIARQLHHRRQAVHTLLGVHSKPLHGASNPCGQISLPYLLKKQQYGLAFLGRKTFIRKFSNIDMENMNTSTQLALLPLLFDVNLPCSFLWIIHGREENSSFVAGTPQSCKNIALIIMKIFERGA